MSGFSIKQIKAILSEHNMPVDDLQAAAEEICGRHTADFDSIKEQRDANKAEVTRLTGELNKAKADAEAAANQLKAELEQAKTDAANKAAADAEKLEAAQSEIATLKADATTKDSLIADLTKTKSEYEAYKTEQENKVTTASKEAALGDLLKDMGMSEKGVKMALKYTDMNGVELNDKGKIANAAALRKALTEEWGDFIQHEETKGAETATPPVGVPAGAKSMAEIMQIKDDEQFMAELDNVLKTP